MSDLPTPTPAVTPETEPFWEATREEQLLLRYCTNCEHHHHYPRAQCPHCFSEDVEWVEASGKGTVYSFTVVRQTRGRYSDVTPYVLAYVELREGPRMLTNVVDVEPTDLSIGNPVEVTFEAADEYAIPRFTPA